jgi:antitoxin component YwqK of YwqJK toxin-antitoxin module
MPVDDGVDVAPRRLFRHLFVIAGLVAASTVVVIGHTEPADRPIDELVRQGEVFLDPETLEPYTGTVFATFEDNPAVVARRVSLREGRYDGPYRRYFESGQLFEEGTYRMGSLDGPYVAYWEGEDLYERGTYRGGAFDGPRTWYLDGRLVERATYVDGVLEGPYQRFAEDGTLDVRGELRDGKPCGSWLERGETIEHPSCGMETEQ